MIVIRELFLTNFDVIIVRFSNLWIVSMIVTTCFGGISCHSGVIVRVVLRHRHL